MNNTLANNERAAITTAARATARHKLKSLAGSLIDPSVADQLADAVAKAVLPLAEGMRLFQPGAPGRGEPVDWQVYNAMHLAWLRADGKDHQPYRGSGVEEWLKAHRDRFDRDEAFIQWTVVDNLLDVYRLHADTGTPLGEHVCEQHCDCGQAGTVNS